MLNIQTFFVFFAVSHYPQHCLAGLEYQLWGVRIFTGDEPGAGTDIDFIQLDIGWKGLTEEVELTNPARKNFQRNQIDYFYCYLRSTDYIVAMDVKIAVLKDKWLLKRVEIERLDNQTTVVGGFGIETIGLSPDRKRNFIAFDARSWWFKIPKDHPLYFPVYTTDRSFILRVVPSDMEVAGTTNLLCIQFYNDDLGLESRQFEIKPPSKRGTKDTFQFTTKHIGKPTGVKVWFKRIDKDVPDKRYGLDRIELEDIGSDGKRWIYVFNCFVWLKADLDQPYHFRMQKIKRVKTYRITTYTATDKHAGTNKYVSIKLEGRKPNEETDYHRLDNPCINDFKKGATDTFMITTEDVGLLKTVRLKIVKGDSWHMLKMDIEEPLQTGWTKTYEWPNSCWVSYPRGVARLVNYLFEDSPHD